MWPLQLCLWARIGKPPPEGHFLLTNFSQKFDQKLIPTRRAVFTRFFVKKSCEKIALTPYPIHRTASGPQVLASLQHSIRIPPEDTR